MTPGEKARHQIAIAAWQRTGALLEQIRRDEIRASGPEGIRAVIPTVEMMEHLGVVMTGETGLIEQQRWFAKLRHG